MIKWITLIVVLIPTLLPAGDVNFVWDPNVEPDIAGYRIYRSTISGDYTEENRVLLIPCGPRDETCAKGTDPDVPPGEWFWVVTAFDTEGFESDYSNEQTTIITGMDEPESLKILNLDS